MNALALIQKTQSLIASGDIVAAEAALVELADTEGDHALMVVLDQLPPKDILAVIREYDTSKNRSSTSWSRLSNLLAPW